MVRLLVISGLVWTAMAAATVYAQPPVREPPAAAPSPPATPPVLGHSVGGVVESKLPIYVRDRNGTEVAYPSITLEEIDRLREQQRVVQPPRFTFTPGGTISGIVAGTAADLEFRLQVQLTKSSRPEETRSEHDWVRIPLRLNQAILMPPVGHEGTGEFLVDFNPKNDGYVLWLRAASGSAHTFSIRVKVPVLLKNGMRQLRLSLPDTPMTFRMTVPGNGAEARVNGSDGNILTTRRAAAGQTDLLVDAAGGEIDLSWRELVELPPVLAAFGNILVSLEGRQLEFDAQLNVRSYGPPVESFVVRLPPGTELIATNQFTQPGLEYSLLPDPPGVTTGRRVLVRRKEGKTAGLIEGRLRCHASASVLDAPTPWQLAGFEVIDAKHQKGTVDFQVDGDWTIDWLPDTNVRQVDDLPDVLRQQRLAARFEYDRQPFSLQATIREKKTRISVEPIWTVSVEAKRLRLEGLLKYRISGARAKPLEIDTGGWHIEQVAPAELLAGSWHVDNNKLIVPLSATVQSGAGEFELTIQATREHLPVTPNLNPTLPPFGPGSVVRWNLTTPANQVSFPIPRPVSDAGLPASVVISPDDNIELSATTDQLRRLVVSDMLPPEVNHTRQQQPLLYREDLGVELAVFVGQFRVRPQAIAVDAETRIQIGERSSVDQEFVHRVSYDPVRRLRYLVPRALVDGGQFELLVDGLAQAWTREAGEVVSSDYVAIAVDLRDPRIGTCKVIFRHRHPRDRPTSRAVAEVKIPLVQVFADEATTLQSHRVRITAPTNLAVSLPAGQWSDVSTEVADRAPGEVIFESDEVSETLQLSVAAASGPTKRSTDLQRVWIQSLFTDRERRERVCFRLVTDEPSLTFHLPPGVKSGDITVAINGQRSDRFRLSNDVDLRVELGDALTARETTVELWYWFTARQVPIGRIIVQAPQLEGTSRADRAYWQLVLPRHEYLAWQPAGLVSENSWERQYLFWSREPQRSQTDLETWAAASSQPDLLREMPSGFHAYLFSSVGSLDAKTVYTTTRQVAVLSVAGCVLLLGAVLLYVPALRHPMLLLAAAVTTVSAGLVVPEIAVASAQLIALGLALVVITGLLRPWLARPMIQRTVPRSAPASHDSRASKQLSGRLVSPNSHVTTATMPAPVPVSATGDEP